MLVKYKNVIVHHLPDPQPPEALPMDACPGNGMRIPRKERSSGVHQHHTEVHIFSNNKNNRDK
jgi:hypothetical protein